MYYFSEVDIGWSKVISTTALPFVCEILQAEAYRISLDERDFSKYRLCSKVIGLLNFT